VFKSISETIVFTLAFSTILRADVPPNIILILADDMGSGEPSYAGGLVPTPAIDSLARDGIRFTDAHTSSSVCTPTRYGILTGRYNWRSRLKGGVLCNVTSKSLMDPKRLNLPKMLQKAGYHTACIGKWHLGVDWVMTDKDMNPNQTKKNKNTYGSWEVDYSKPFKNGPIDIGFDEAFFILASLDMPPYLYLENNRSISIPTVNKFFVHNEYNHYHRTGAAAKDFEASECLATWAGKSKSYIKRRTAARKNDGKPFFLYLSLTSPHTPNAPGKKFAGKYPQYSSYADVIAETDWVVQEVLSQLKESGADKDTIVMFTSDNGFAPYVKIPKMKAAGYKPSGKWRGSKANIYEGGHRVPFIVRWPGKTVPGTTCDKTICTTDFYATFADIAGFSESIPDNAAEDSFSFIKSLQGGKDPRRPFTIHHSISGKFAIRQGDWKLILDTGNGGGWNDPTAGVETTAKLVQLYNLKTDPCETENLELQYPERIDTMVDTLAKAIHDGRTTPGKKQKNEGIPKSYSKEIKAKYPQLIIPKQLK
jgi:arylsulfatase A-like enzyme